MAQTDETTYPRRFSDRSKRMVVARYVSWICFGLTINTQIRATTVITIVDSDRIIMGADALERASISGSPAICKIHREHGFFFATVGLFLKRETGFDAVELARKACRETEDIHAVPDILGVLAREPVRKALAYSQRHDPLVYKRDYKGHAVFEVIFAGFLQSKPTIGIKSFYLDRMGELREQTITLPDNAGNRVAFSGEREAIKRYTSRTLNWYDTGDLFGVVRKLIGVEIADQPEKVGPPISVVEIRATGYRWLQSGKCSNE
jgi:hypothetical protein